MIIFAANSQIRSDRIDYTIDCDYINSDELTVFDYHNFELRTIRGMVCTEMEAEIKRTNDVGFSEIDRNMLIVKYLIDGDEVTPDDFIDFMDENM